MQHLTTPIFYPNAKPHLGHLYSTLLADVKHRWFLMQGKQSFFTTGTDEHGLKIQLAAELNGYKNVKPFVDTLTDQFKTLDKLYNLKYTRFIRTTDLDHISNVRKFWLLCQQNGFIYKGEHKGWYSVSDESFYPDSKVVKHQERNIFVNTETQNEVTYQSEINYFFKLSHFQDKLLRLLSNDSFIQPQAKRLQLLKQLEKEKLNDISISRPKGKLTWGIEVPNDSTQIIYVWFDALINYISSLDSIENIPQNKIWPKTQHIIGKDIMKFHCLYWPSFLWSINAPLPERIIIHNHWLSDGVKMSKSLGNVVDPQSIASQFGVDIIRWYVLENSNWNDDNNFDVTDLQQFRQFFIAKWGNLINRCCSDKFNLARAIDKFANFNKDNFMTEVWKLNANDEPIIEQYEIIFKKINNFQNNFDQLMTDYQYNVILREIWSIINSMNYLITIGKPWTLNQNNQDDQDRQDMLIFMAMETSRILSIFLQPFIPTLSNMLLDRIDVPLNNRSLNFIEFASDNSYGKYSNRKGRVPPISREVKTSEYSN